MKKHFIFEKVSMSQENILEYLCPYKAAVGQQKYHL